MAQPTLSHIPTKNHPATDNPTFSSNDVIQIPAMFLPGFRTTLAIQKGVETNLLFRTWGGLGDQICAEPTLRFALNTIRGCKISLASEHPELFEHLKFHKVYNLKKYQTPNYENYLLFDTITPPDESNLVWQFFGHMITNCVDFPSMCALRCQLPVADKEVRMEGTAPDEEIQKFMAEQKDKLVFFHAGRHWPSKTFPKDWWDKVLGTIIAGGSFPVLIGANTDDNRGTVNVDTFGCIDWRNKFSIKETIWLLKNAKVLLTNDSSPMHMAADSDAWVGYIATCKHPDFISHWRRGQWNWRMVNHGLGGIWDVMDYCPNKQQKVDVDQIDPDLLRSWLPDPVSFGKWALSKLGEE